MHKPAGHTAVMASAATAAAIEAERDPLRQRHLRLNYFPTPPWATRALLEYVIPDARGLVWEPAAGEGHMAAVLGEHFDDVWRSDVHDYGGLHDVGSYTGSGAGVVACPDPRPDWIITNPPFALALEFVERALSEARDGVAVLVRTAWMEGAGRYERLFRDSPPSIVAAFVERVPMTAGAWDPDASTATAYAWFVWRCSDGDGGTALPTPEQREGVNGQRAARLVWIPPGCRQRLTHEFDRRRFAGAAGSAQS